jgi:hypothetical protein
MVLVRERTMPTDRPPLVGEVSANFADRGVSRSQRNGFPRPYSRFSRPDPLLFLPGIGKLKKLFTSSSLEPATFWLVA